jgi:hypothetical protein
MITSRRPLDRLRVGFFATLENPEPRYVVEVFPFLIILAGAGASVLKGSEASEKATVKDSDVLQTVE